MKKPRSVFDSKHPKVNPTGSKLIRRYVKAKTGEKMQYSDAKTYYDEVKP